MSYPPGPQDPYGKQPPAYGYPSQDQPPPSRPPYGYPQQAQPPQDQPRYGYPQQGGQPQYGYPQGPGYGYPQQPGHDPNGAAYGYQPQPPGTAQANNGLVNVAGLGTVQVATMGQRFLARLLDGVVIGIVDIVASFAGMAGALGLSHRSDGSGAAIAVMMGSMSVFYLFAFLYEWLMVAFAGATLGKMALGLRVARERDGQHPGLGSSFVRYIIPVVGMFLCFLPGLLVYLSPYFDNSGRLQGWHDRAAGTLVVKK